MMVVCQLLLERNWTLSDKTALIMPVLWHFPCLCSEIESFEVGKVCLIKWKNIRFAFICLKLKSELLEKHCLDMCVWESVNCMHVFSSKVTLNCDVYRMQCQWQGATNSSQAARKHQVQLEKITQPHDMDKVTQPQDMEKITRCGDHTATRCG